jgi:hypothetical protein
MTKTIKEHIPRFIISLVFSLICWVLIDRTIVDISFIKYILIEIIIIISGKLYERQIKYLLKEE